MNATKKKEESETKDTEKASPEGQKGKVPASEETTITKRGTLRGAPGVIYKGPEK